ncbi:alpha/beta hydrolase [Streptomyces europaeiscabiei]|uniref:alpha/beta hydrolase n=1 Tax=Streptomyces europaeiscabiei TaxID=146819 RepID=UPI00399A11FE
MSSGVRAVHHSRHGSRPVVVSAGRGHGVNRAPGTTACADRAMNSCLRTGRPPAQDVTCRAWGHAVSLPEPADASGSYLGGRRLRPVGTLDVRVTSSTSYLAAGSAPHTPCPHSCEEPGATRSPTTPSAESGTPGWIHRTPPPAVTPELASSPGLPNRRHGLDAHSTAPPHGQRTGEPSPALSRSPVDLVNCL